MNINIQSGYATQVSYSVICEQMATGRAADRGGGGVTGAFCPGPHAVGGPTLQYWRPHSWGRRHIRTFSDKLLTGF